MKTPLQLAQLYRSFTIATRRRFHQYPELSHQEIQTTAYIKEQLEVMGIPYVCPAPTGVIAVIQGAKPGKTMGLRADIDALPIQELNEGPYSSRNPGIMHACGHDAHGAALLTAAKILQELRQQFAGTVKLIFQPAEEHLPSGALAMTAKGHLDDCAAFFGLHVKSDLPVGRITLEEGPRMAASAGIAIRITGKGGHGGQPHQTVDAALTAAAALMNLQTLVSRELDPQKTVVVTIGSFHAGTAKNIIAQEAFLEGTCRFFDPALEEDLRRGITRILSCTAEAYRAKAEVEVSPGCPAVINDPKLSALGRLAVLALWPEDKLILYPPSAGNEDFSYYARIAPALYVGIGSGNPDKGSDYPHHHPRFDIDEDMLEDAAALYAQYALAFLNQ